LTTKEREESENRSRMAAASRWKSDGTLATANGDLGVERWTLCVDEPEIGRAEGDRLDVVVEGDVCEDQFQLLRGEETTWAVIRGVSLG
jgi:hypothetical protein